MRAALSVVLVRLVTMDAPLVDQGEPRDGDRRPRDAVGLEALDQVRQRQLLARLREVERLGDQAVIHSAPTPAAASAGSVTAPSRLASRSPASLSTSGTCRYSGVW